MTRHDLVIWGGAGAALVLCVAGIVPGLSWLDAGDFVTATATLGVAHPTGFPVTTLGGHAFTWLPVGSIPTRVALVSAVSMAWAVGLLLATLKVLEVRPIPMAAIGLLLICALLVTPTLYIHGRVPEVYATNVLLVSAGLYLVARYRKCPDARVLAVLALVCGLALTHHALFRLWVPVLVVGALWCDREGVNERLRHLRAAVGFGVLGLLAFAYLPAAAMSGPAHNWGQPDTLGRFWAHANAETVRMAFDGRMLPGLTELGFNGLEVFRQLIVGVGPFVFLGPLAAVTAAALLWRKRKRPMTVERRRWEMAAVGGVLAALDIGYAMAINPMGNRDLQNLQIASVLLLVIGGMGLMRATIALQLRAAEPVPGGEGSPEGALGDREAGLQHGDSPEDQGDGVGAQGSKGLMPSGPEDPSSFPGAIFLVTLALLLLTLLPHGQEGLGRDFSLEDMTLAHLADAEPSSLTGTVSDSLTAAFLYTQITLRQRPDIAVYGRSSVTMPGEFAWSQRRLPFEFVDLEELSAWLDEGPGHFDRRNAMILTRHLEERPIYWEASLNAMDLMPGLTLLPGWPLALVVSEESAAQMPLAARFCVTPRGRGWCEGRSEPTWGGSAREENGAEFFEYRQFLAGQLAVVGALWLGAEQLTEALAAFEAAVSLAPHREVHHANLAVARATAGDLRGAIDAVESALQRNPMHRRSLENGIVYAEGLGETGLQARFTRRLERLER